MDLHWKVCPYCGNSHFDPYQVGPPLILAEDVVAESQEPDADNGEDVIQDRLGATEFTDDTVSPGAEPTVEQ
jgi:hypothetical protein